MATALNVTEHIFAVLRETLLGVRGMAEIERASGSRTWGRAIALIDAALADTGEESP